MDACVFDPPKVDPLDQLLASGGFFPEYSCVNDCTSFSMPKVALNSSSMYYLYAVHAQDNGASISGAPT